MIQRETGTCGYNLCYPFTTYSRRQRWSMRRLSRLYWGDFIGICCNDVAPEWVCALYHIDVCWVDWTFKIFGQDLNSFSVILTMTSAHQRNVYTNRRATCLQYSGTTFYSNALWSCTSTWPGASSHLMGSSKSCTTWRYGMKGEGDMGRQGNNAKKEESESDEWKRQKREQKVRTAMIRHLGWVTILWVA